MTTNNATISEQYAETGHKWADLKAAANLREDTKSAELARLIQTRLALYPNEAFNKAEMAVKAGPEWAEIVMNVVETRRLADHEWINLKVLDMRNGEQISHAANERIVAKL